MNNKKSNLTSIAAVGKKMELGYDNNLVWRIPSDLGHFQKTTDGQYIFMGRKTFDSIPRVLENRKYLVLSKELKSGQYIIEKDNNRLATKDELKDPELKNKIVYVETFSSPDEFLEFARNIGEEIYIIGGSQIYSVLYGNTNRMILTEIDDDLQEADVHFPKFNKDDWTLERGEKQKDPESRKINVKNGKFEKCDVNYRINIYERI